MRKHPGHAPSPNDHLDEPTRTGPEPAVALELVAGIAIAAGIILIFTL